MLSIENLKVQINGTQILKDFNIEVKPNEIHAIMGPNGSGKSTFSKVIAGHPQYNVTGGKATFTNNQKESIDLLPMSPDERAKMGIFLSYQYPVEVPGVPNIEFLRACYNSKARYLGNSELDPIDFEDLIENKISQYGLNGNFLDRHLNVDLSGGEKKQNELLQMAVLDPQVSILDETDSGLDIDSLKVVSNAIKKLKTEGKSIILITHYQRILSYIVPDHVHIMKNGKIIKSGGKELAYEVEKRGYSWIDPK